MFAAAVTATEKRHSSHEASAWQMRSTSAAGACASREAWIGHPAREWAISQRNVPSELLRAAGYDLLSDMVMGHIREPEKQRAGVYGTARQMVSCLTDREVSHWVTPARDADPHMRILWSEGSS